MATRRMLLTFAGLFLFGLPTFADAPLKTALNLNMAQAKQVSDIQAKHRREFASVRQERNRELRKLRRAKIDNDAETVARQEAIAAKLQEELRRIQASEDTAIRKLLTPEQSAKFDDYIKKREAMVGSSRDAGDLK